MHTNDRTDKMAKRMERKKEREREKNAESVAINTKDNDVILRPEKIRSGRNITRVVGKSRYNRKEV